MLCIEKRPNKSILNWQSKLEVSFVPLSKFEEDDSFLGFGGSSALIDFRGSRFVCSVLHVFTNNRISLQLKWDPTNPLTSTLPLFPINSYDTVTTRPKLQDFAICDISHNSNVPMFQELEQSGTGKIIREQPRTIYTKADLHTPQKGMEYGFAGTTLPKREDHPLITIGSGIVRVVSGLSYEGDSNGFHQFKLPVKHPGHEFF